MPTSINFSLNQIKWKLNSLISLKKYTNFSKFKKKQAFRLTFEGKILRIYISFKKKQIH